MSFCLRLFKYFQSSYFTINFWKGGNYMKDIGLILKNARENKGLTQKQVMELTGINRKSLSGYENNVAEPDLYTISTLAQLYGLSLDEIFEIKGQNVQFTLSKLESLMLTHFRKLDAARQRETIIQLDALTRYLESKNFS